MTGTTITAFAYEYDPAGHKTRQTDADGDVTTWIYDAAYQLRAEHRSGPNGFSTTFAYDPVGNRLTEAADGDVATFQYDAAHCPRPIKTFGHICKNRRAAKAATSCPHEYSIRGRWLQSFELRREVRF